MENSISHKPDYWARACVELSERDGVMRKLIAAYEGESLASKSCAFTTLCRAIIGQQISVKAADSITARLERIMPVYHPEHLTKLEFDALREVGLSRQKINYLNNIAEYFLERDTNFHAMSDAEVLTALTSIKGIGGWTAEMFLIFHLMRPNVWPIKDIGLQKAVQQLYESEDYVAIGKQLEPWRTVATWYLWRSLDPTPVSY